MKKSRGQLSAGIDNRPVVDGRGKPVTIGCTLRAIAYTCKAGEFSRVEVTIEVTEYHLPYCALQRDDFTIPFQYDPESGCVTCECCELVPATTPFYSRT